MDEYTPCKTTGARRRKALTKEMRAQVYAMCGGHCAYCGKEIDISEMQVDHVQAVYLGGEDEMANYRPACRQCNFYKSTMSTEGLREQLALIPGRLEKQFIFRLALAYGLVRIMGKPIKFYFEEHTQR